MAGGPRQAGFTLIEILLVLALIVSLALVMVVNYPSFFRGRQLDEGARAVENALRLARSEAASAGKRVQIVFDKSTHEMQVLIESKPLVAPGKFEPLAAAWVSTLPNEQVRVERCNLLGEAAAKVVWTDKEPVGDSEVDDLQAITFWPDGSNDWAILELSAVHGGNAEQPPRATVEIDSLGAITRNTVAGADLEDYHEKLAKRLSGE